MGRNYAPAAPWPAGKWRANPAHIPACRSSQGRGNSSRIPRRTDFIMQRATNSKADGQRAAPLSASNGERAGVRCRNDGPPKGNANFAHGSMSSSQPGEGATQRTHIKADWEISSDEMRTTNRVFPTSTFETHPSNFAPLPGQLFYSTKIPVCLWFLAVNKKADPKRGFRDRRRQILVSRAEPAFTNFSNN